MTTKTLKRLEQRITSEVDKLNRSRNISDYYYRIRTYNALQSKYVRLTGQPYEVRAR